MSDAANTFLKDQLSESLEQFSSYERIEVEGEKMIRAAFNPPPYEASTCS
jgi:hypothetical protein